MVKVLNIIKHLFSLVFDLIISVMLCHPLLWIAGHASQSGFTFLPVIALLIGLHMQLVSRFS